MAEDENAYSALYQGPSSMALFAPETVLGISIQEFLPARDLAKEHGTSVHIT